MAKINNKSKYPIDINLSLDDFVIGSDADNLDFTRNYALSGIFSTFKTALNLASIEYTFSDGVTDPTLDENDAGFFTTNSTSAPAVVEISINTLDSSGIDVTSLLEVVDDQPTAFVLRLFKASVTGQVFYFAISAITDNLDGTYALTVENFVGGNTLEDGTTYSFVFDLAGIPSIYTETDPVFLASPAGGILAGDITKWNTAFGWGDHATEGYLKTVSIGDITGFTDNSTNWNTAFGWGNHAVAGYLTSYTETDPVFLASPAGSITVPDIATWDLAYSWGDHSLEGYLTSESDPVFTASPAFGITTIGIDSWNAAYSWGDHAAAGYLKSSNIDTFAELNGILTDATLIDTNDSRLSDARTPLAHTHVEADITDLQAYLLSVDIADINATGTPDATTYLRGDGSWQVVASGGGTWGSITGTLSDQTDLVAEFGTKVDLAGDTMTGALTAPFFVSNGSTIGFRASGFSTGNANVSVLGMYESDGTTRQGYVGFGSAANSDLYLFNDVSGNNLRVTGVSSVNGLLYNNNVVLHQGNDGDFIKTDPTTLSSQDWDSLTSNRFYQSGNATGLNRPPLYQYGQLVHSKHANGELQVFYSDTSSTTGGMAFRTKYSTNAWQPWSKVWTNNNDGAGSGLDADALDGKQGIQYCESGDGLSGDFNGIPDVSKLTSINASANTPFGNAWYTFYQSRHRGGQSDGNIWGSQIAIGMTSHQNRMAFRAESSGTWGSWNELWHSGNDGAGSGLDADLWDGVQRPRQFGLSVSTYDTINTGQWKRPIGESVFVRSTSPNTPPANGYFFTFGARDNGTGYGGIYGGYQAGHHYFAYNLTSADPTFEKIWTELNDGAGSGLDADLLDGVSWGNINTNLTVSKSAPEIKAFQDGSRNSILLANSSGGALIMSNVSGNNAVLRGYGASQFFGGNLEAPNFVLNSDRRLKKNIKDIKDRDLSGLRWREFDWKSNGEHQLGLIAQEVEETNPEFAYEDEQGIKKVRMMDILIASNVDKDKKIESLEQRIERLEQLIMNK